ncbi:uncharacterized protein BT62DRAFT_912014, partial [Guyanagaster necrorhizus]
YDGPFKIIWKISPVIYQLRLSVSYRIHSILNITHLKRYSTSPLEFGIQTIKNIVNAHFKKLLEVEVGKIEGERMFKTSGKY